LNRLYLGGQALAQALCNDKNTRDLRPYMRGTDAIQRGIQNLLRQELCKGAERDSQVKFGKETVAGARRRLKGP